MVTPMSLLVGDLQPDAVHVVHESRVMPTYVHHVALGLIEGHSPCPSPFTEVVQAALVS